MTATVIADCHANQHRKINARTAASATVHCLTGCSIGEFLGLAIGVSLGWAPWQTITLAVVLAFISGYALSLIPLMRGRGLSFTAAFKIIWLGELISIGVMELAMNIADYQAGGMHATSVLDPVFWIGFAAALTAGFVAAYPVNYWMLKRNMKACHQGNTD